MPVNIFFQFASEHTPPLRGAGVFVRMMRGSEQDECSDVFGCSDRTLLFETQQEFIRTSVRAARWRRARRPNKPATSRPNIVRIAEWDGRARCAPYPYTLKANQYGRPHHVAA